MEELINSLRERGCSPHIYKRGTIWRAYVNRFGNFWEDHDDPETALRLAVSAWEKCDCPVEGNDIDWIDASGENVKGHELCQPLK